MSVPQRAHGQAPSAAMLHPVWHPTTKGEPPSEEFVARCLLGAGWVGANRRLSMLDLRVWAALCAMLGEQLPTAPPHDPELQRIDTRTVDTTGYQLAERVFSSEGGDQWRSLRRSLARLRTAEATIRVVEVDPDLAAQRVIEGYVPLTGEMWIATTRLDLNAPKEWGALKGTASLRVEVGRWAAEQIVAGRCKWLDLDLLRALGPGLAARAWVALEAWGRWPQHSFDGREETAIGLGKPALESLGVGGYARPRRAREALDRAGERIVAMDPSYELVRCEKRAGWCLVVRRLSGAKARAQARSGASWHSSGIAANKRRRSVRAAVRAQARASLPGGAS
jgi:hypothetical protein